MSTTYRGEKHVDVCTKAVVAVLEVVRLTSASALVRRVLFS